MADKTLTQVFQGYADALSKSVNDLTMEDKQFALLSYVLENGDVPLDSGLDLLFGKEQVMESLNQTIFRE